MTLQRGAVLLLRFSVFQHDVGFSAFFHTQPSGDAKQECIEVIVCVVSPAACAVRIRAVVGGPLRLRVRGAGGGRADADVGQQLLLLQQVAVGRLCDVGSSWRSRCACLRGRCRRA